MGRERHGIPALDQKTYGLFYTEPELSRGATQMHHLSDSTVSFVLFLLFLF